MFRYWFDLRQTEKCAQWKLSFPKGRNTRWIKYWTFDGQPAKVSEAWEIAIPAAYKEKNPIYGLKRGDGL